MKKFLVLILMAVVITSLVLMGGVSCKQEAVEETTTIAETTAAATTAAETTATQTEKKTIAVAQANLESSFPQAEGVGAKQKGEELGYDILSLIADGDAQKQASQIEDAISKKVAAVTCWPADTDAIVSSVNACKAANIPYIALSRMPADLTNITAAAVVDNFGAATLMAQAIGDYKKSKGWDTIKVIELVGDLADQNAKERTDGYKAEADRLGLTTIAQVPTEWNADKAYEGLVTALKANPDVQAIYIPSDFLWPAVQSALKTANMLYKNTEEKHVFCVAMDGDPNGLQAIRDGYLDFNVNQDPIMLGELAITLCDKAIKGETIEEKMVPVENVPITIENVDTPEFWGNVFAKK